MLQFQAVLRYSIFGLVVLSAIVALGSWLVRTRRVSPFSALGRTLRSVTDPIIRPVERRLARMGGNPTQAGGWLVVIMAVAGILLLSVIGWLVGTVQAASAMASGPRGTVRLIVDLAYRILLAALIIRVIAAWFGMFRYSPWVRPVYILTDWIVAPIRRVVPPLGAVDLSPLVAMMVLSILRQILLSMLRG